MLSRHLSTVSRPRRLWRWGGATAPTAVGEATAVASGTEHGAYAPRSPSDLKFILLSDDVDC